MEIQLRMAEREDLKITGDLFARHLDEQFSIDPYAAPNKAFDAHLFIEAMMNPKVNHIILAYGGERVVGFVRLGILYADRLMPLGGAPRRTESSYLKRLPVIILSKFRDLLDALIFHVEKRRTVSQMVIPTRRGYIADLYVVPDMRRKGVGSALVRAATEWFASRGVLMVDLSYIAVNEAGKQFWKAMGFEDYRVTARKSIA